MENTYTRTCKVSAGKLPEGFEAKVEVEFEFTGVDAGTERSWAVSHLIIAVQRVLRNKTTAELNELSKTGYKVKAVDAGKGIVDVSAAYKARFATMTVEDQMKEIERLTELTKQVNMNEE